MASRGRWLLVVMLGVIYLAVLGGIAWWIGRTVLAARHVVATAQHEHAAPLPKGRPFTRVETNTFLDAAKRAEAIPDPLQRCLAYPDPPGSHWDREVVVTSCRYRLQPIITYAQVKQMVQAGRARELDRMFDDALHAQMTDPGARGRLDRVFYDDFNKADFDIRSTLDAWKRQSPHSAYAYAASGYEYAEMASEARGSDYISRTPQSAIDAMNRLAGQADADLQQAIKLNPKIMPVYSAMISIGGISLGDTYAMEAVRRGLTEDPGNLGFYGSWMWLEQPNWYGSLAAMNAVARSARTQSAHNPLLRMMSVSADSYRIEKCDCSAGVKLSAYEAELDHFAWWHEIEDAGKAADAAGNKEARAIYFSEALRFKPELHDTRIYRLYDLVDFDRIQWAIDEANRLIASNPDDEAATRARGWAYLVGNDLPHAQKDFETAARLNPADDWAVAQLSGIYMQTRQWDKAWDIASRMIEKNPELISGWTLRASIQMEQPRPGLQQTADYLESHFYTDKKNLQFNAYIAHLRAVAQGRAKGTLVLDSHG